jgi:copper chaperone
MRRAKITTGQHDLLPTFREVQPRLPYLCTMKRSEVVLSIEGMSCGHCVRAVKELAEEVQGVVEAKVSLESREAVITVDDRLPSISTLIDNINSSNTFKAQLK